MPTAGSSTIRTGSGAEDASAGPGVPHGGGSTPLVSIDLVVENPAGAILLGLRSNRPAAGWWFVPGGRVYKNEPLDAAFTRLGRQELGVELQRADATLLGVYEHLYPDSVFGADPDTHYVVLGYHLRMEPDLSQVPRAQHTACRWWSRAELTEDAGVHANSLAYLEALA